MFYLISKLVYYLAMPYYWILACFILAWVFKKDQKKTRAWMIAGVGLWFVFSNNWLANVALGLWEYPPTTIESLDNAHVGILLGGMVNQDIHDLDRSNYNANSDRIIQAAALYKQGKISKILITGGSDTLLSHANRVPEADLVKESLISWGIPSADIWVERKSLNTYQNALYTKQVLDEMGVNSKCILITSAFHMRRSIKCFQKQGVPVVPYAVDYKTLDTSQLPYPEYILPTEGAPSLFSRVFRELLGITAYKAAGYI